MTEVSPTARLDAAVFEAANRTFERALEMGLG